MAETNPQPFRVCFVCTGNICRSPMAEVVFRSHVERAGLGHAVAVASAGLGSWHVGDPPEHGTVEVLAQHGLDGSQLRARQFRPAELGTLDLVIGLDRGHLRALQQHAGQHADKVRLLRDYDPDADGPDVPDPYGGPLRDFEHVYRLTEAAMPGLLDAVRNDLDRISR
ncbi:MAG: low molecular weight phosphotyrosine protein phosphatase [Streptosporangiales bacterium]|nr:low molecular weight phosphotyrosine protein phosphatase [Streptosporangiales bacterium]